MMRSFEALTNYQYVWRSERETEIEEEKVDDELEGGNF